jgi:hypothetical protein
VDTIEHKLKKIVYKILVDPNLIDPPLSLLSFEKIVLDKNPEMRETIREHLMSMIQELVSQHHVIEFDEIEVNNKFRPVILDIDRSKLLVLIKMLFDEWFLSFLD